MNDPITPRFARAFATLAFTGVALLGGGELLAQTTPGPKPGICSRSCWNARAGSASEMSALNRAVIHHTAGTGDYNVSSQSQSAAKVRAIQNLHMDSNGWSDIGYHFLVDKLGNTFEGRIRSENTSYRPRGAHDANNTNSFGFNVMGYYHPPYNQSFTSASRNALWNVIAWRMPSGWSPYGSGSYNGKTVGRVAGHRNVKSTACPGDGVYATIGTNYSGGEARNAIAARRTPGGGNPQSKPGWYRVSDASWHLRNSLSGGASDITFVYGPAGSNVVPVTGDWNGDGEATAGWYRHSDASWHLKNSNSGGSSDYAFVFGLAGNNTIVPVTGDWNGDGKTTVGWFRPSDSSWHLRNSLSGGASHYAFVNGAAGAMPVTGDWNGNGKTTVGWYRHSDASWHLRNSLSGGASDYTFVYGVAGNNTLIPVTGDWNANGKTTIGWYRPADASWHLRNSLSGGTTDYAFVYGATNAIPVAWAE